MGLLDTLDAGRRMLVHGFSRPARERMAVLGRHFADPWRALMWLRYYRGPSIEQALRLKDGGDLFLRLGTTDRVMLTGVFEEDEYRLDRFAPASLGCVVDIGGHAGFFARRAASIARRVLTFEPVGANFALLSRNVDPARFPHVKAFRKAVAREPGALKIRISPRNTGGHSAFITPYGDEADREATIEEVECVTLPQVLAEEKIDRIDLLKLDCEGAEFDILASIEEAALFDRIDRIALEFHEDPAHPERTGAAIERQLAAAGYTVERKQTKPQVGNLYAERA